MNQGRCRFLTSSPVTYLLCSTGHISDAHVRWSCQGCQRFWGGKTHCFQRRLHEPGIMCLAMTCLISKSPPWWRLALGCLPPWCEGRASACFSLRSPGEPGAFLQHARPSVSYSRGSSRSWNRMRSKFPPRAPPAPWCRHPGQGAARCSERLHRAAASVLERQPAST